MIPGVDPEDWIIKFGVIAREVAQHAVAGPLAILYPHRSNSAEIAEKPLRATLLAEPFPGAVAQGGVLVIAKEFRRL
jgi:hypothetical protein